MSLPDSPQSVLQHYFDELFTEDRSLENLLEVAPAQTPEPKPEPAAPVMPEPDRQRERLQKLLYSARTAIAAPAAAPLEPAVISPPEPAPSPLAEAPVVEPAPVTEAPLALVVPEVEPELDAELEPLAEPEGLAWLANGRPSWAQERFDVLLFSVSGLTLAVPLVALGQIQPLTDELTPLFGQADWFMGLQPTANGKIRTVNTARFVMPERYDENFVKTARYVVSIDGVPWGLAVDAVNQPISLDPDDVKWRGERTKRPWLAGTVKAHMCALLDIPRIGQLLMAADRNARRQSGAS